MKMNAPVLDDMYPGDWHLVLDRGIAYDVEPLLRQVLEEMQRAIEVHGLRQTPAHPKMENGARLAILGEEYGEVAGALTYDKWEERGERGLRIELTQTAAVAVNWLVGLALHGLGEEITSGRLRRPDGADKERAPQDGEAAAPSGGREPSAAGGRAGSPGGDGSGPVAGRAPGRRAPGEPRQWYE